MFVLGSLVKVYGYENQTLISTLGTIQYIFMKNKEKIFLRKSAPEKPLRMVEAIFRCKWSLTVYQLLKQGINRPGQMVKQTEGLTTKVLNECLKKNTEFGILKKTSYKEIPPRVEYKFTSFGNKFLLILHEIEQLQAVIDEN